MTPNTQIYGIRCSAARKATIKNQFFNVIHFVLLLGQSAMN
jgi:hypothetical protein